MRRKTFIVGIILFVLGGVIGFIADLYKIPWLVIPMLALIMTSGIIVGRGVMIFAFRK
ncbi:hypothetical protein OJ996_17230 [Luteolibacter sp. GHJ8]|jgi:hypothetical protein|uniref:Uncharacterized protein n=1 Tax=Luteolibacter rhizosphaerae TaxID=2989719 RepID=A0ABT3G6S4_9BACT|nr:hypothetical protein [Luteolibacter rhizosphaerae]